MAASNNIPRELQESIKDLLDKQVKVTLKKLIKFEVRPDKTENRVLALSGCRLFILTAKVPSRLETSFNFLDIQSIESKKANQLTLIADGKTYHFYSDVSTEDVNHIITHIGISLKQIFTSYPLERLVMKIEVHPPERLKPMHDLIKGIEKKDSGPCGGFTTMYQCMCDYHGLPYREEVAWDVDTIYLSHDCRELRLQDFDHLNGKDLIPIIGALEHNSWFKRINASNVKLTVEVCSELIKVMKRNSVIEDVNLSGTGIKLEFVQKFALAIISNAGSQLNSLDLSNNLLDDRAIQHLLGAIIKLPCGLTYFDISRTGITTKCLNKVAEVFAQSPNVLSTLTTLKLNDNGMKGEDYPALYNFLAQPNVITHLDLSFTDCALDSLCDPLLRGCPNLAVLKASRTVFTHKKTRDSIIPQSWKQLFASSCCLEHVDFSSCKLPSEAVKELLLGLSSNRGLKNLCLDLSNNELGSSGASVITSCIATVSAIRALDISNNGFDADLKAMFTELAKNTHLKSLAVGRNFSNIKPKAMTEVMNALAALLQEETSVLESLSLAESKLKTDTTYVINALGSNNALQEIDISGNAIGDLGARMLAKALLINSKLRKVVWDKNNISVLGFEDVAEALQRNVTLKKMPYPINDAAQALRLYPERTEAALQKIESYLQRNNSPRRFASAQAYRLQQNFLISSTQQMVDRLIVQVEDTIEALRTFGTTDAYAQEIETAEKLLADANKSKMLLPGLQDIGITSQSAGNPIDSEFNVMSGKLTQVIETHMKKTTDDMLKCTSSHCPAIMNNQAFQSAIKEGCLSKSVLPKDFSKHVLEGASADVYNLTSEINLAMAALISDRVIEEIIDSMTACQKSLGNHLNLRRSSAYRDKEKAEESAERQVKSSVSDENSPELANKRKTLINRKTRPQSTMGDDAIAQTSKTSLPTMVEKSEETPSKGSIDALSEITPLASTSSRPLEHLNKTRPKREKAHRPTRPIVHTGTTELEEEPTNGPLFIRQPSQPSITVPPTSVQEAASNRTVAKPKPDEPASKPDKKRLGIKTTKVKEEKEKEGKDQKDSKKSSSFGFSNIFKKKPDKKKSFDEGKAEPELPTEPVVTPAPAKHVEKDKPLETVKERTIVTEESPTMKMAEAAVNNGEQVADEKLPTSPRVPKSAILPPPKVVKAPTLAAEEDFSLGVEDVKKGSHEEDEKKDDVAKLPVGVVKMPGLGALGGKNLLHEMKATHEKRFSKFTPSVFEDDRKRDVKLLEDNKRDSQEDKLKAPGVEEDGTKDPKPAPETNNNISLRHLEAPEASRSRPSSSEEHEKKDQNDVAGRASALRPPPKPGAPPPPSKPAFIPKPRSGSTRPVSTFEEGDEVEDIPKSMTASTPDYLFANSSLSATSSRPTPPVKPRPMMPKPRKSGTGVEDADTESSSPPSTPSSLSAPPPTITTCEATGNDTEGGSGKTEPVAPASGVVYDSATLRLTVKDKIKRLSKNNESSESSSSSPAAPVVHKDENGSVKPAEGTE